MSYMRDWRGSRLDTIDPVRDLPALAAWYDASTLALANGAALVSWPDRSGKGIDLAQGTASARPTVTTNSLSGWRTVNFPNPGGKFLFQAAFGSGQDQPAGHAQPITFVTLARVSSTGSRAANGALVSGNNNSTDRLSVLVDTTGSPAAIDGSGAGPSGAGPAINDDQWHVRVDVFGATSRSIYIDGFLVGTASSAGATNAMKGIAVGGMPDGNATISGADVAEVMVLDGALRASQVLAVTAQLRAKWGLSAPVSAQVAGAQGIDGTDSGGTAIRYWLPAGIDGSTPRGLIIWSHPAGHTQLITPGYWAYTLINAAVQAGWMVVASNLHGDSWGNAQALTDTANAYTYMNTINPVSKVAMVGGSMGGVPSLLAAKSATVANIKGCFLLDAVTNLPTLYGNSSYTAGINTAYGITAGTLGAAVTAGATSITSSVSIPSGTQIMLGNGTANVETVTTTAAPTGTGPYTLTISAAAKSHASGDQISDYPAKTVGHDPNLIGAGTWPAIRYQFTGSASDATVPYATNGQQFSAGITGATENAATVHLGGHIAPNGANPAALVAFLGRL